MQPILIGLHGRRGAGKDTAFKFVQEWATERGVHAARRGFADLLKLSFARLFFPDMNHVEAVQWCDQVKHQGSLALKVRLDDGTESARTVTEEIYVSGRTALQRYGTEGHRDVFGDDFWVDALLPLGDPLSSDPSKAFPWIKSFTDGPFVQDVPQICAVTDVRFENEAQRIKDLGGEIWQVERHTGVDDSHASEQALPGELVDRIIWNRADLLNLREIVFGVMDGI